LILWWPDDILKKYLLFGDIDWYDIVLLMTMMYWYSIDIWLTDIIILLLLFSIIDDDTDIIIPLIFGIVRVLMMMILQKWEVGCYSRIIVMCGNIDDIDTVLNDDDMKWYY